MKSSILPEAELEAADAAIWYEAHSRGLGDEFTEELRRTRDRIGEWPDLWPRLDFYEGRVDVRRCFMNRFPYRVVFLRKPDEIVVIAVCHTRQQPLYWLERLT